MIERTEANSSNQNSIDRHLQYVRKENNDESTDAHSKSVGTLVYGSLSGFFSPSVSSKAARQAQSASYQQSQDHETTGTVVITVNCTHRRTDMFSPLVLDADKAVSAYNTLKKDDQINMNDLEDLYRISQKPSGDDASFTVLSGQTTGSSFVGLVHIVQKENTSSSQSTRAVSTSVSAEIERNLYLRSVSGGFGLDASYSNNLKNLVSSSEVESYCNVFTMGCIPTIASNTVETSVARLAPSAKDIMGQLDAIQGASDSKVNNSLAVANQARKGESFMQLNNSYVKSVVSELGSYDNKNNKVIDMNSLMTALDDFILEAKDGQGGVPINFFVKKITKQDVAREVMKKYYPYGYDGKEEDGGAPEEPEEDEE